ncbi:MAG: hypothetical protein V5804_07595 [Mucilaginibacter sp.]|uniref:hypothetical protein n=1 Tax=Mucilaginibacter sp. TaxID=1882438 RepID=UPI0034E4B68F
MTEALNQTRQPYQPENIQILFVEEAVQPGNMFFYRKNSNVFRAVKEAFGQVFGEFKSHEDFLQFFKANGCYVDYLCPDMINGLTIEFRKQVRTDSIKPLSERLVSLQPKVVITVMKVLEKEVLEAIRLSGIDSVAYTKAIAFPAHSKTNADKCVNELVAVLEELLEIGILGD